MKKELLFTLASFVLLSLVSCGKEKNINEGYTSVSDIEAQQIFSFDSNLQSKTNEYPLSSGNIYYVSSSFEGESKGTQDYPYKTLDEVNNLSLKSGDSVLFKCGDTFEGTLNFSSIEGEDDNPITIASYGEGNKPIISSKTGHGINIEKASNVVVRDLKVKVYGLDRGKFPSDCRYGIRFYYPYVGENKYRNIYIFNNEVEGNSVSDNVMGITISSLEGSAKSSPRNVVSNVYVKNNLVHTLGRSGITSSGWLVNEKINQNNSFMDLYNNIHFDNNVVYDVGCIGIYILGCTDSTINRNLIHDTGVYTENQILEGECGIMALGTKNCDILFNECYNIFDQETGYDAMGIDIDWNTTNVNVQYNYLHDCQGPGVGTMANQNSYIRNNRIENCLGDTNHQGALSISNYTSRYDCVDEDMHAVRNLLIEDNLILHNVEDKALFLVMPSNGDETFKDNKFIKNHLVYTGDDSKKACFVNVDSSLPWYKFAENQYYSKNIDNFRVFESTSAVDINIEEGAQPYTPNRNNPFEAWSKRDLGATYSLIDDSYPCNPKRAEVKFENGKLLIDFEVNKGEVWHYNIFEVGENEEISYRNMIGQVEETHFEYSPIYKEERYIVIVPESNVGVYGKALKIKVVL